MKKIIFFGLILLLVGSASAALSTLASFATSDTDGVMVYGTRYNFTVTATVTDEATGNLSACSLDGVAMANYPVTANGSGPWFVYSVIADMGHGDNCSEAWTVTCTQINGSEITTTNSSWNALPCVYDATTDPDSVTQSITELAFDVTVVQNMKTTTNMTRVNLTATGGTSCSVICRLNDDDNNVTVYMPYMTFNVSHSFCAYECYASDADTVEVQQAGYLGGDAPERTTTGLVITVIVGVAVGAAAYMIGKSRR